MSKTRKTRTPKKKSTREKDIEAKQQAVGIQAPGNKQIKLILEWFREGLTDEEIRHRIRDVFEGGAKLKDSSIAVYLGTARAVFNQEYNLTRKFNIIQHIKRYDRDIYTLANHEPKTSSYKQYQYEKGKAYLDMIDLLQKKEKVLGFHRKTVQLKIKNTVNIGITRVEKAYDFTELTWEEKMKLYELTNKAWINPNEKLTLKPNPKVLARAQEEVEEAEVVEEIEENVIELIREKPEEIQDIKEIGESKEIKRDKNIIDATNPKQSEKKNLEDIRQQLLNKITQK